MQNFRPSKIPPQVTHLMLVAVGIVTLYLIAWYFLFPHSFGEYGFYRGDALDERVALPVVYGGEKSCAECHKKAMEELASSSHKTLGCEGCHGPSYDHVVNNADKSAYPAKIHIPNLCLRCHLKKPGRPKKFPQIKEPDHSEGSSCLDCHNPHQPKE